MKNGVTKRVFFFVGFFAVGAFCFASANGCNSDEKMSDLSVPHDLSVNAVDFANSPFAGIHCGEMSCPDAQVCCVRPTGNTFSESCETAMSCMANGAAAECDGPEDCSADASACCANVSFMRIGNDSAVPKSGSSACTSTCSASVNATSEVIEFKSKLCHVNGDCAGYMGDLYGTSIPFDGCCYRPEIDLRFCAPSDPSYRNIGGYYCL